MNVFITGATGVLGRVVSRLLIDGGHHVRGLAQNAHSESRLRSTGVEIFRGTLFDQASLRDGIKNCDAILHLATRIPPLKLASSPSAWRENDRIRIEGTRNLIAVALESTVSTFVYPSVVFVYPDRGDEWIDANTPPGPSILLQSTLTAESEVERFTRSGKRGVVLRMGAFYGPTTSTTQYMLQMTRYRVAMIVGRGQAYQAVVWVDDAALAVVDGLVKASAGIYDIVDDEPLQRRELAAALADVTGRRWLVRPPRFVFRVFAGRHLMFMTKSLRVSNRKFKKETGWSPTVANAKLGLRLSAIQP